MENKELEALNNLTNKVKCNEEYRLKHLKQDYDIVRNALIRNQKLEKAIDIVKNKLIDVGRLYGCIVAYPNEKTPIHYNEKIDKRYKTYMLTEEEFNLLKEVFGNETICL